ncbi:MAG: hypothetical protein JRD19_03875, partial [Deltaproteobacteria bacterium]|nr:hypothetical protein [Deltaproteobacteria bacterium]
MQKNNITLTSALPANTPVNAAYYIENEPVQLVNGLAEREAAPGSASKIKVAMLGEVLYSDLNYDKEKDAL